MKFLNFHRTTLLYLILLIKQKFSIFHLWKYTIYPGTLACFVLGSTTVAQDDAPRFEDERFFTYKILNHMHLFYGCTKDKVAHVTSSENDGFILLSCNHYIIFWKMGLKQNFNEISRKSVLFYYEYEVIECFQ